MATLFGGILLAGTTCAGFWATLDLENESAVSIAMWGLFALGLLVVVVGVVLVLLREARLITAHRRVQVAGDSVAAPGLSSALQALGLSFGLGVVALGAFAGMTAAQGDAVGISLLLTGAVASLSAAVFFLIAIVRLVVSR